MTQVTTWVSPGLGESCCHLGLTWIWWFWFTYGALQDLVPVVSFGLTWNNTTLIHIWASPVPGDSGPYMGITGTWLLSSIPGPHLDLVTLVTLWTSP